MKKLLSLLLALFALGFGGFVHAEYDTIDYSQQEVLEIEAERYEQINEKWQIEVSFKEDDVRFYVYNINDEQDLISEVRKEILNTLDIDLNKQEVSELLEFNTNIFREYDELEVKASYDDRTERWRIDAEIEEEGGVFFIYKNASEIDIKDFIRLVNQGLEDYFDFYLTDEDLVDIIYFANNFESAHNEITYAEAILYKAIGGVWEIRVELADGSNLEFYVYNVYSENDLVDSIENELEKKIGRNVTYDEIIDELEFNERDFENTIKLTTETKDTKNTEVAKTVSVSVDQSARDAQILALQEQIALLMELVIELLSRQLSS